MVLECRERRLQLSAQGLDLRDQFRGLVEMVRSRLQVLEEPEALGGQRGGVMVRSNRSCDLSEVPLPLWWDRLDAPWEPVGAHDRLGGMEAPIRSLPR